MHRNGSLGAEDARHAPRAPWTALLGLLLLWGAFLAVAYFVILLALWFFATADPASETRAEETLSGIVSLIPLVVALVVLVLASLRHGWARWAAVGLGLVAGALGLVALAVTGSPAPETVAMAGAAIAGAVLLALPSSRGWFRPAAPVDAPVAS